MHSARDIPVTLPVTSYVDWINWIKWQLFDCSTFWLFVRVKNPPQRNPRCLLHHRRHLLPSGWWFPQLASFWAASAASDWIPRSTTRKFWQDRKLSEKQFHQNQNHLGWTSNLRNYFPLGHAFDAFLPRRISGSFGTFSSLACGRLIGSTRFSCRWCIQ